MIELRDKDTGRMIGSIPEEDLEFLLAQLEEESEEDADYYINKDTLAMFAERGVSPRLLELLTLAMGEREEMEVRWSRV
ncbi:MAG: galactosyldiacylglycerol synthase [bacterium]